MTRIQSDQAALAHFTVTSPRKCVIHVILNVSNAMVQKSIIVNFVHHHYIDYQIRTNVEHHVPLKAFMSTNHPEFVRNVIVIEPTVLADRKLLAPSETLVIFSSTELQRVLRRDPLVSTKMELNVIFETQHVPNV